MRKLFPVLIIFLLTGCTTFDTFQDVASSKGAATADEVRDTAEWVLCRGISVGAWVRAYGDAPQKAEAWRELCSVSVSETPAKQ